MILIYRNWGKNKQTQVIDWEFSKKDAKCSKIAVTDKITEIKLTIKNDSNKNGVKNVWLRMKIS